MTCNGVSSDPTHCYRSVKENWLLNRVIFSPIWLNQISYDAGDLGKFIYRSHVNDPMSWIFSDMINIAFLLFWNIVENGIKHHIPTPFLAHLCELLPSLGVRRPSVNFFKNLLLWNHQANLSQTWPESSLGGSL